MSFKSLGLAEEIVGALEEQGYSKPTVIQQLAIPKILSGVDVIAGAQTGTGKTASFTLPLLQRLFQDQHVESLPKVKALILAPTRELACQVHSSVEAYAKNLPFKSVVLYGGVEYAGQISKLEAGAHVVVATPGRLMDLLDKGYVSFHHIQYLVVDEADRMLDMGFVPMVRRIMARLPRQRQTLFFSATFSPEVKALAKVLLKSPVSIQAEKLNSTAAKLTHVVHPVDIEKKRPLLSYLIGSNNWQQVLIFTRTKASADCLSKELTLDGIRNMVIHGDRTQAYRAKSLSHFKEGKIQALVATDIAARGLDIENLPYVINYELPNIPEDYVHRVGRTGRAGQEGLAVTLVTDREVLRLMEIEKLIKMQIEKKRVPGFEPRNFDPDRALREQRERRRSKVRKHAQSKGQGKSRGKGPSKPFKTAKPTGKTKPAGKKKVNKKRR